MTRRGFEEVIAIHDRHSGLEAFLAIHDTSRGPAFGGIRRWAYRNEREALMDCLRLSQAMSRKCALAGLQAGGAKVVLLDRDGLDLEAAYRHIGRVVERMAGRFYTGPDMGTGESELQWLAEETRYATRPDPEGPGMLAESTAEGVFRGAEAALVHLDGEAAWGKRRVVVQGLGAVGARLAERLLEHGVTVLGADIDEDRAQKVSSELEIELVDPSDAVDIPCDVYSPCGLGGAVHDVSIERLRCRVIAGGANNVLARRAHGDALHDRDILYAPDFVINSGALIRGSLFHMTGERESLENIGARVGRTLREVFEQSKTLEESPEKVAVRIADERIERFRSGT